MENVQQGSNRSRFDHDYKYYNNFQLTIRILFHSAELGNVIGKGGETVKNIRDLSGARISISDSSTPERIVTIIGTRKTIGKATELIGLKIEEFFERKNGDLNGPKAPLTFKLILPASQRGCIIGKDRCNLKEFNFKNESGGAAIELARYNLPNSTEFLVEITGTAEKISQCVYRVCKILINFPPRGATIPYDHHSETSGFASSADGNDFPPRGATIPYDHHSETSGFASSADGNDVKMENVQQSSNGSSFNDYNDINLTIRILFHGREVGNVIGKGGETVKNIRDQSGARVLISDGSTPERIVTITGTTNEICKATELIGLKVEEFFERQNGDRKGPKAPLTFMLIVPASQCGFIIGKGGCKIKEIIESSGAAIQVASVMLPNSTERLVSITGTTGTISQCVYQVCNVLLDSPPRSATIPYDPRSKTSGFASSAVGNDFGIQRTDSLASFAALELGTASTGDINPAAALAESQLRTGNRQNQNDDGEHKNQNSNSITETISMSVIYDFHESLIGEGGSKIAEIQQKSGALVHIAKVEGTHQKEEGEYEEHIITITGNKDSISVAKNLIEKRYEFVNRFVTVMMAPMPKAILM